MRLFLAIDLPEPLRERLARAQTVLRERCPGWRWARPEGIHLTLRFLGEVPGPDATRDSASWREAAASAREMVLRVEGAGVFPDRGRPRVLWTGVHEDPPGNRLATLASALETAARERGFTPESRPFRPHLTLARAGRAGRAVCPDAGSMPEIGSFAATEVTLFRSELHPAGARYSVVDRFPLG